MEGSTSSHELYGAHIQGNTFNELGGNEIDVSVSTNEWPNNQPNVLLRTKGSTLWPNGDGEADCLA